MYIRQISVFVENKPGKISRLTDLLAEKNIDIKAMTIADTSDFGIIRFIVENPEAAVKILGENHFTSAETDVLACEVPDVPGGLAKLLDSFRNSNASIEYLYSFVRMKGKNAVIIVKTDDQPPEDIKLLDEKELFSI